MHNDDDIIGSGARIGPPMCDPCGSDTHGQGVAAQVCLLSCRPTFDNEPGRRTDSRPDTGDLFIDLANYIGMLGGLLDGVHRCAR